MEGQDGKIAEFTEFLRGGKKRPLTLLCDRDKKQLLEAVRASVTVKREKKGEDTPLPNTKEGADEALAREISALRVLKREVEDMERETGRYELFIGYPFVFGALPQGPKKTLIKAPLLLFPVRLDFPDETTCDLYFDESEKVRINPALVFLYAQSKKLNVDALELEFDDASKFRDIKSVLDYLAEARIKIDGTSFRNIFAYGKCKEPEEKSGLSVRYAAVLGRFPLANSIYSDYTVLEEKKLNNDSLTELLTPRRVKPRRPKADRKTSSRLHGQYAVKGMDYAQSEVLRRVNSLGNMVIYGPPGTGKSQTIVNIITDAIAKGKRVLVVSQKKAALDVVYNRLGPLGEKAMYLTDEGKEKRTFYERCLSAHQKDLVESLTDVPALQAAYDDLESKLGEEERKLSAIDRVLNEKRPFGLSLCEMYNRSVMLAKSSQDYATYVKMLKCPALLRMSYGTLTEALTFIQSKNLASVYYRFLQEKEKNPVIDYMKSDLDIRTLSEVKGQLEEWQKSRKGLFNTAKYPYYRQILAYYYELRDKKKKEEVIRLTCRFEAAGVFPSRREQDRIRASFDETMEAMETYVGEYDALHRVLTPDGYLAMIDNILRGNTSYIRLLHDALENYIAFRDTGALVSSLDGAPLTVLNFAYTVSKTPAHYEDILSHLLSVRIYHEVLQCEKEYRDELSAISEFANVTSRIRHLQEEKLAVSRRLCQGKLSRAYDALYEEAPERKDYLYQISKKQKFWPIRKTMEIYGDFILTLFPCWLLSPENVSCLLPLRRNTFDLVVFDEASQVFIENTVPAIYRGKNIVVAGDTKQLRPSATFMKRYLGGDPEAQEDYSVQAALEVESLLDLAQARYDSAHLTYHYRSQYSELIDFSNHAFYGGGLQVAPNVCKSTKHPPIERIKTDGRFIDRKNSEEAQAVVARLRRVLKEKAPEETVGIITFNSEQQGLISDLIDKEAANNTPMRPLLLRERNRKENGEDVSLFVKNLENVQGDERDIILFSVGYGENEDGKVYTNFGSLSCEGGENRLNVAVTRARQRIIVVTSIEPEQLKVETSKFAGPKLLKAYLTYVRAVSDGDTAGVRAVLRELDGGRGKKAVSYADAMRENLKERLSKDLEKIGLTVDDCLGNENSRLSLAIYDPTADRYLLGIELDTDAYATCDVTLERDVYKPAFWQSRGWVLMRVFSRDFWLSPTKVTRNIVNFAEKLRKKEE